MITEVVKVSIITPVFNSIDCISECIESIIKTNFYITGCESEQNSNKSLTSRNRKN
jgi:hypothetical protein